MSGCDFPGAWAKWVGRGGGLGVGLLGFNSVFSGQNILTEAHLGVPGPFSPSLFFTMIVSQLWRISLLKTSCCLATEDTRSVVWTGVVATISAQDGLIISEPGKMTLQ